MDSLLLIIVIANVIALLAGRNGSAPQPQIIYVQTEAPYSGGPGCCC